MRQSSLSCCHPESTPHSGFAVLPSRPRVWGSSGEQLPALPRSSCTEPCSGRGKCCFLPCWLRIPLRATGCWKALPEPATCFMMSIAVQSELFMRKLHNVLLSGLQDILVKLRQPESSLCRVLLLGPR